jgi:hypothetical protein
VLLDRLCTTRSVNWAMLDDAFDVTVHGGKRFDIKASYREDLLRAFPEETAAINGYFDAIVQHQTAATPNFVGRLLACLLPKSIGEWARSKLGKKHREISDKTLANVLDGLTNNVELRGLLSYVAPTTICKQRLTLFYCVPSCSSLLYSLL